MQKNPETRYGWVHCRMLDYSIYSLVFTDKNHNFDFWLTYINRYKYIYLYMFELFALFSIS